MGCKSRLPVKMPNLSPKCFIEVFKRRARFVFGARKESPSFWGFEFGIWTLEQLFQQAADQIIESLSVELFVIEVYAKNRHVSIFENLFEVCDYRGAEERFAGPRLAHALKPPRSSGSPGLEFWRC